LVGAVTFETTIGKQRPDVAVEINFRARGLSIGAQRTEPGQYGQENG
jgi:hypothetical protein